MSAAIKNLEHCTGFKKSIQKKKLESMVGN
jgi:hypothetical protein